MEKRTTEKHGFGHGYTRAPDTTTIEGASLQKPDADAALAAAVAEAEAAELPPPGTAKPSTWLD